MNISLAAQFVLLSMMFVNHFSFGMEETLAPLQTELFYSVFPLDIYPIIFRHSNGKNNLQNSCKHLYSKNSIKLIDFSTNDCGMSEQHMIRVLLNAAYVQNYKGVENILQKSSILQRVKSSLFIHTVDDTNQYKVLDLYDIAQYNEDEIIWQLLEKYKIPTLGTQEKIVPTKLVMACLAGNSKSIECDLDIDLKNKENAFKIVVDCDHSKCFQVLINDLYDDSNLGDIVINENNRDTLLSKNLLWQACSKKKLKVLQKLLATNHFDLNSIDYDDSLGIKSFTVLDKILELLKTDLEYKTVAALLEYYGAKTSAVRLKEEIEEDEDVTVLLFPCIIF